jgi:hypothetical protein
MLRDEQRDRETEKQRNHAQTGLIGPVTDWSGAGTVSELCGLAIVLEYPDSLGGNIGYAQC